MKKITLRKAISLYNKGVTIHMTTSKITPQIIQYSPWLFWEKVSNHHEWPGMDSLRDKSNEYKLYNCNKKLGLRVHYYVYNSDL